jgi:hypothetical protein
MTLVRLHDIVLRDPVNEMTLLYIGERLTFAVRAALIPHCRSLRHTSL